MNQNLVLESIGVGIYTVCIGFAVRYALSSLIKSNTYWYWFATGFAKHFMGFVFKLHSYYCLNCNGHNCNGHNCNGHTCNSSKNPKNPNMKIVSQTTLLNLTVESCIEGLLFVLLSSILVFGFYSLRENVGLLLFIIGFSLHIAAEVVGVHAWFCENRCSSSTRNMRENT